MQARIAVREGEPFTLDPEFRDPLRSTLFRLQREMSLSFPALREDERGFTIWNLIGSIDIGRMIVEVAPKTDPRDDWVASILSLLVGTDAVDAAGERSAGHSAERADLVEALGAALAARLTKAVRRDGPIMILSRERHVRATLRGKLLVTEWLRSASINPARFPQEYGVLSADNDFSKALAFVADRFARVVRRPLVRAALRELRELLRPGLPIPSAAPAGVELRQLPPQWGVYRPAWAIAAAVLARRSLLGPQGVQSGVSIAIEPWPLLERLLERSLRGAVEFARSNGRSLSSAEQATRMILERSAGSAAAHHYLRPDGVLLENGAAVATFEAKYQAYDPQKGPREKDVYQALAAARACNAPLAVLVYPGKLAPARWRVMLPGPHPARLAVLGLDMFDYRRAGERSRGQQILDLVNGGLPAEQKEIMVA